MRIRIRFPEDRDYAGRLEVLDANGAVILGPFPAAGRAHDMPAAARGNASRNPLLPYGDTPTGTYVVRGVVESSGATALDSKLFGGHGVVLLEPVSGQAALADANGRFRLFIQGGSDEDWLRATVGSIRLLDRDQQQLAMLLHRTRERVFCEIITTEEHGSKIVVTEQPLESDPPLLPGRPSIAIQPPRLRRAASVGSRMRMPSAGGRSARSATRFFVIPEHSGSGGGQTAYGGVGDTGGSGPGGVADTGVGANVTPDQPIVTDASPVSGVDLAPAQEPAVTQNATGASQLLSTAAPTGFSSPYGPAQGGWQVAPQQATSLSAFVGDDISTYTATPSDPGNPNPYTGTQNVGAYTGNDDSNSYTNSQTPDTTHVYGYTPEKGIHLLSPDELAAMRAASTPNPDIPYIGISTTYQPSAPQTNQPSDNWVDPTTLQGLTPSGTTNLGGTDYAGTPTAGPSATALVPGAPSTGAPPPGIPPDPTLLPPDWYGSNFPPTTSPSAITGSLPPGQPPSQPWPRAVSAIPGGLGVGSIFAPQPNWYYRALADYDPTIAQILSGADIGPIPGQPPFVPPSSAAEGTFRHMRGGGNVLTKVGTDRISVAENIDAFTEGGPLSSRGDELVRIDIDKAKDLGAEFYDNPQIIQHLQDVESQVSQELADAQAGGRGQTYIDRVQGRLDAVHGAQERADPGFFGEGEFVNRVPSGSISEVSGASIPEAAASEARFLRGLEVARGLGEGVVVVGAAMSVERVMTAPPDQAGRVLAQEGGGWAFSFPAAALGAEGGAAIGAAFGIETGPGAIVTGAIGGLIGGAIGFFTGQVIGDEAYSGFEAAVNWVVLSMVQGQIEQDAEAARRGSTTGELPPPYLNNGPTGDPFIDAFP